MVSKNYGAIELLIYKLVKATVAKMYYLNSASGI
jgi:hypothetical protein